MEPLVAGLFGLIGGPLVWPLAVLVGVIALLFWGKLLPKSQVDALLDTKQSVIDSKNEQLKDLREDHAKQVSSLERERDMWRQGAQDAQAIAQEVREQNRELIESLDGFDHLVDELRSLTGVGGEKDE